jgi:ATP-dependent DNA helicase RecQ
MISGYLHLSEGMMVPSRVMFKMDQKALYDFQLRHPNIDPFIRLMLRTYGGLFETYSRIDEHYLARKTGWGTAEVIDTLKRLDEQDVIGYRPRTNNPSITLLTGRQRSENIVITKESYEDRMQRSIGRFEQLISYLHLDGCRSQFIAHYFGDQESDACGHCDWCRKNGIEKTDLRTLLRNTLKHQPMSHFALIDALDEVNREELIVQLNRSIDEGEIERDENDLLRWVTH